MALDLNSPTARALVHAEHQRRRAEAKRKAAAADDARACECEHIDHFDGGPCHAYGARAPELVATRTMFGTFHVCPDCVPHLADFTVEDDAEDAGPEQHECPECGDLRDHPEDICSCAMVGPHDDDDATEDGLGPVFTI